MIVGSRKPDFFCSLWFSLFTQYIGEFATWRTRRLTASSGKEDAFSSTHVKTMTYKSFKKNSKKERRGKAH
jgi:hypothetical protein